MHMNSLIRGLGLGGALLSAMFAAGVAVAADPVTVGVIANLTGSDVKSSEQMVRGVELAVAELDAAGGIGGRPLKLIVEDSEYKTQEALNAATKLYDIDKVDAAIMFGGSSLMLAVAPIAKEKGKVLINTSSSSPKLGGFPGTLFSILPLDDIVGKELGTWIAGKGVKTVAFVVPNNTFGTGLMDASAAAFEAAGGKIVSKVTYTEGQPDYRADLQQLVALKPDAIVTAGYGDDSRTVFKNARALGLDMPWYAAYPSILTVDDPAWMNGRLLGVDNGGLSGQKAKDIAAAYAKKYGAEAMPHVFYGYDAMMVLAKALAAGGDLSAALPKAIENYAGATGAITWDERGQRIDPPIDFIVFKDGAFVTTAAK